MTVQFKIKGSKISSSQVAKKLADLAQKNIEKDLKKTISKVRCSIHRKTPTNIRFKGFLSKNDFQAEAKCCCENLQQEVHNALQKG